MAQARKRQVSLDATPYYHCTSRCVRRAFLCGEDPYTGQSYEHRRQWIEDRLQMLAQVFSIQIAAYAVMSNHLHVVLHVDQPLAESLSEREVCERWHQVYQGTLLTQKYAKGEPLSKAELTAVSEVLNVWRKRLMDISWFMRTLNEPIARQANLEDKCSGRFWEGRFTSQALLDEHALLACMAYVDLNPIRAKMAETPEGSDHTSIKSRILAITDDKSGSTTDQSALQPNNLLPFTGDHHIDKTIGIPYHLKDYLELVDWTGRAIRSDKRGAISSQQPHILSRLQIPPQKWLTLATQFEKHPMKLIGKPDKIKNASEVMGYRRTPGLRQASNLFL